MSIFPDKNEVLTELVTRTPMFIEKLDGPNLKARGVRTHGEYIMRYENSLLKPSAQDRTKLNAVSARTRKECAVVGLHHLVEVPWRFAICEDTLEGGMPHTIGSVIVLPERVMKRRERELGELLVHEATHLHQRAFPDHASKTVSRLGFEPVRRLSSHREILRANPDTNNMIYALGRMEVNPVLHQGAETLFEYTLSPHQRYPGFASVRNHEHPFEIVAEINAEIYAGRR